jgi:hypothetical protein
MTWTWPNLLHPCKICKRKELQPSFPNIPYTYLEKRKCWDSDVRREEKKSDALFSTTEGKGNHPPFLSLPFSSSSLANHGRELLHRQQRAPAGSPPEVVPPHARMRRCGPSRPDCVASSMASSCSSASRTPPPLFSMCGDGGDRICHWRWLLHWAVATSFFTASDAPRSSASVLLDGLRPRAAPLEELAASRRRRRGDTTRGMVCGACCKRVSHVFRMSHKDVARVLCRCCKSRSRFFNIADVDHPTQTFDSRCCNCLFSNVVDVATTFNIFFMLQTLILDVADVEFWCCSHVVCCVGGEGPWCWMFATINFRCWVSMLQTCVVGCCKHYFSMF